MNGILEQLQAFTPLSVFVRLLLAALFGGVIGLERGRRGRPAGLRTHMLVCMGSTLVMLTNLYSLQIFPQSDPMRLGAQVINGIGFLGAGTIIVDRQRQVKGLTTAAGLWASACMGLAVGIGFYAGAIIACVFVMLTIAIFNRLEQYIIRKSRTMEVYVEFEDRDHIRPFANFMSSHGVKTLSINYTRPRDKESQAIAAVMTLRLPRKHDHLEVLQSLDCSTEVLYIEEV